MKVIAKVSILDHTAVWYAIGRPVFVVYYNVLGRVADPAERAKESVHRALYSTIKGDT